MSRIHSLAQVIAVTALVAAGVVVAQSATAGAASPGPIQITLQAASPPGVSCPNGTYVAVNPGPPQSPTFVLINPGPPQCPQGNDVLVSPGPAQAPSGQAVALPLTAKSCASGTALLNQELSLIGSGIPGAAASTHSTSQRAAGCPSGDAALAALQAALANVPSDSAGRGFITPGSFGLPAVQKSFLTVEPGSTSGTPALTATDENKEISYYFTHSDGSHQLIVFKIAASGLTKVKIAQFSPVITLQPVSQSTTEGSSLMFTASAIGNPAPTVQWQFSIDGGASWTNTFPPFGTMTAIDTGALFNFMNGWQMRAVFTNSIGTATSDPATMTVT